MTHYVDSMTEGVSTPDVVPEVPSAIFAYFHDPLIGCSGVPNFLSVALVMFQCGLAPVGIRLDSGDLAALSKFVEMH